MIGIYNDSSSTTFSVYTYGEIVWPGGSSSAGVGYYISALVYGSSSYIVPSTFTIGGSTYRYTSYCTSVYGHNYSQFYFSNFDGVITEGAFSGFKGFEADILDTNATRVESMAFAYTSLSELHLSMVSYLGYGAFSGMSSLSNYYYIPTGGVMLIDMPICETVEPYAFYYCKLLRSINLPVCKNIGAYAFCGGFLSYYSSRVLSFPSCENIGNYAFSSCTGLRNVSLPVCRTLGEGCFMLTNLSSISLPQCEYIGSKAFLADTQLRWADFDNCSYIGDSVFNSCTNLSLVILHGSTVCELGGSSVFYSTSNTLGIKVKSSLYSEYLSAPYWSDISGRISSF